jgi:uncharacterized membrane protein YvbJ
VVYCSKCGHKNPDDSDKCASCGQPLETRPIRRAKKRGGDDCFGPQRDMEKECFGLPHGGMVFTIVIGVVIVFIGLMFILRDVLDISIDIWGNLWAVFFIIIGILVIGGALSRSRD